MVKHTNDAASGAASGKKPSASKTVAVDKETSNSRVTPVPMSERLSYTIAEFCGLTGISPALTWSLIDEGKIKAIKIGRRVLISAEEARRIVSEGVEVPEVERLAKKAAREAKAAQKSAAA